MCTNYFHALVFIMLEEKWVFGPKSTGHFDRSKIIEFKKIEQIRQENYTEYPSTFSLYVAQYIAIMEENGWWIKVNQANTDEDDEESEDPFEDINDIIETIVDFHNTGYSDDENDNDDDLTHVRNLTDEINSEV